MSDTPKLDRNKPSIGHILPEYDGAQYQDGEHFFAGNGEYLFSQRASNGKRYTAGAAKAAPVEPVVQPLAPNPATDTDTDADADATSGEDIDFKKWATGEVKYEWFKIKAAASAKYGDDVDTSGKAALIASLKELGVLPEE